MNQLDYMIVGLAVLFAMLGYLQGFIVALASMLGLVLGGVVGVRASQALLQRGDASEYAPLIGLAIALCITVIGSMAMQDLGSSVRRRIHMEEHIAIDRMLGAVLLAFVSIVLVWFVAAASIGMPQARALRPLVLGSAILGQVNGVLPPAGPVLGLLASYDPFPSFDGPRIDTAVPDGRLPVDPQVRAAAHSVVRVTGTACGYRITGSGWVAARGYVVTNAHVVAGEDDTGVQRGGRGDALDADVVFFDTANDLAVLRVDGLALRPLGVVRAAVPRGTAGAVLGYPESGPFDSAPARFSDTRDVETDDLYGRGPIRRRVTSFRGAVRHGNSGGPMVDGDGNVLTTVFASTVGKGTRGGYGIPNVIVDEALQGAVAVRHGFAVSTGTCVS